MVWQKKGRNMNLIEDTLFMAWVMSQIKQGYSPLVLIVGRQRTGKTSLALRFAWDIGERRKTPFDIRTDMFYTVDDFAENFDKYSNKVFVLDEAGITLDPYEHMSITQRVYSHIIQSQAYKQNIVFLVLPYASEIGRMHRKHVDAIVEVFDRGCYKLYKVNRWHSDLSMRPPRIELIEVVVGMPLPPPEIWQPYRNEVQDNYKKSIMDFQMDILAMKRKKRMGITKPVYEKANFDLNARLNY